MRFWYGMQIAPGASNCRIVGDSSLRLVVVNTISQNYSIHRDDTHGSEVIPFIL